jgi:hypothetical protein
MSADFLSYEMNATVVLLMIDSVDQFFLLDLGLTFLHTSTTILKPNLNEANDR